MTGLFSEMLEVKICRFVEKLAHAVEFRILRILIARSGCTCISRQVMDAVRSLGAMTNC